MNYRFELNLKKQTQNSAVARFWGSKKIEELLLLPESPQTKEDLTSIGRKYR